MASKSTAGYTHGHSSSVLMSHEWRTLANSAAFVIEHVKPTSRILDVGCGPGTITAEFAARCVSGSVVGIDNAEAIIQRAKSLFPPSSNANLSFQTASAYELPFPASSFDIVFAHQVLHHMSDPVAVLKEMRRVCAPGGVVVSRESDFRATWSPPGKALDIWGKLCSLAVSHNGGYPDAAHDLVRYANTAGLTDVVSSASTWCFSSAEERKWWGGLWEERMLEGPMADTLRTIGVDSKELHELAGELKKWANGKHGWCTLTLGEITCRK